MDQKLINSDQLHYWVNHSLPIAHPWIWQCNINRKDIRKLQQSGIWWDIWDAWSQHRFHSPQDKNEILNQVIWYNSHIKVLNSTIFYKQWADCGIIQIHDIYTSQHLMFLTYQEVTQLYGLGLSFLDYYTIVASVPQEWKFILRSGNHVNFEMKRLLFPVSGLSSRVVNLVHKHFLVWLGGGGGGGFSATKPKLLEIA